MIFPAVFILLYVAHSLSDYPLQTDHQSDHKAEPGRIGWTANLIHAGTHVATSGILLAAGAAILDLHLNAWVVAVGLLWIGATHSFIDRRWPIRWWMNNTGQTEYLTNGGAAHVDQSVHLAALAVAALGIAA
ncbi:DUF3307 domain-containing protein [Streptomyces flavofungini]|uniref:DUF3307 domain-containing protein n=1 Tax=Streptomyces flavofungini TaxID=68200 RepID=UPI0034DF09C9